MDISLRLPRNAGGLSPACMENPLPQGFSSSWGEPLHFSKIDPGIHDAAVTTRLLQRETDHAAPEIFLDRIG
ncbi:MAG: hypothetical protein WBG85_05765 [Rhodanobacter sp.]